MRLKELKSLENSLLEVKEQELPTLSVKTKNRSTGSEILKRRRRMISCDRLGLKPAEWVPQVAEEFGASKEAVKRDWNNRKKWMNMYFQTTEIQTLGLDALFEYELAVEEAKELYQQTKNPKMKPTTLGLMLKAIKMKYDFLKEFGILHRLENQYYEEVRRRIK